MKSIAGDFIRVRYCQNLYDENCEKANLIYETMLHDVSVSNHCSDVVVKINNIKELNVQLGFN